MAGLIEWINFKVARFFGTDPNKRESSPFFFKNNSGKVRVFSRISKNLGEKSMKSRRNFNHAEKDRLVLWVANGIIRLASRGVNSFVALIWFSNQTRKISKGLPSFFFNGYYQSNFQMKLRVPITVLHKLGRNSLLVNFRLQSK